MKTVTEEIADLRAMDAAALSERYEVLYGRPPRVRHREHLWRKCAWKLQEQRLGGLSGTARRKLDSLMSEIELPSQEPLRGVVKEPDPLAPGATLQREWRNQHIEVRVLDRGFEYDGVVYRSLSAIAERITGTHWNGKAFFGVTQRKAAKR